MNCNNNKIRRQFYKSIDMYENDNSINNNTWEEKFLKEAVDLYKDHKDCLYCNLIAAKLCEEKQESKVSRVETYLL